MRLIILSIFYITLLFSEKQEILLGTNYTIPPYYIKAIDRGIELDLIRAILKEYKVKSVYISSERNIRLFKNFKLDVAATINENSNLDGFYSDTYIEYQNCIISLEESNITINKLSDIKNYSLLAFQNAHKYLGDEFSEFVKKKENYKEKSNQLSQVKLLYLGRVDLILSDINIFKYYKKILNIDTSKNVRYHCIFPKTEYKVLFRDDKLRDLFNIRLKDLQKSGVYNQILDRYIDDTKSH